jgi:hypothetical protein
LRIIYSIVSRLGCKHFPRNYDAMAERFGLSAVLEKKLKVVPHCPDCGGLVRHPPDPTTFEEGKGRCEFCDGYTYAVRTVGTHMQCGRLCQGSLELLQAAGMLATGNCTFPSNGICLAAVV